MDTKEVKEIALDCAEELDKVIKSKGGNTTDLKVAAMYIESYAGAADVLSCMYEDDDEIRIRDTV